MLFQSQKQCFKCFSTQIEILKLYVVKIVNIEMIPKKSTCVSCQNQIVFFFYACFAVHYSGRLRSINKNKKTKLFKHKQHVIQK